MMIKWFFLRDREGNLFAGTEKSCVIFTDESTRDCVRHFFKTEEDAADWQRILLLNGFSTMIEEYIIS